MGKVEKKQLIRINRWRRQYPGFWQIICNSHKYETLSLNAYQNALRMIQKESLYVLLLVFIETHKDNPAIQRAFHNVFLDLVKEEINRGEQKRVFEKLIKELE